MKENPSNFRSHILSKIGAYFLDNPGQKIIYTDVLDGVSKQLKESYRNEQKKIINAVGKNLIYYIQEQRDKEEGKGLKSNLNKDGKKQIETILSHLTENFGYSHDGAINCLKHLIKKRYDAN